MAYAGEYDKGRAFFFFSGLTLGTNFLMSGGCTL